MRRAQQRRAPRCRDDAAINQHARARERAGVIHYARYSKRRAHAREAPRRERERFISGEASAAPAIAGTPPIMPRSPMPLPRRFDYASAILLIRYHDYSRYSPRRRAAALMTAITPRRAIVALTKITLVLLR